MYGFDPVLEYLDLYFPVKQGLNIRIGRFLSVPGIEAQLAPNNYNMTHSLLYTIDPFTETGCTAPEYAFVNYLNRQFTPKFYVGFRSDMLNEKKGQRTGIPGSIRRTRSMQPSTSAARSC